MVQTDDGSVVRVADEVAVGAGLRVRLAEGELHAIRDDVVTSPPDPVTA